MEKIVLDNGLKVLYYPMDNVHSVTIGLYVKAGVAYETTKINGLTHFLEHLHFRRLGSIDQEELYYKMESMGSSLRGITYSDFLQFSMKVIPEKALECIKIFRGILEADEWTDEEFSSEKQVVLNQIYEKGDYIYIEDVARAAIFSDTPLAHSICGTVENVQHFQKEEAKIYKRSVFNKNNMILCITGHVDKMLMSMIVKELRNIELEDGLEKPWMDIPKTFHHRAPRIVFENTCDTVLDVNVSFDISGNQYGADLYSILNCILGEGVGSHLQKHIREKLGYSSNIYSYIEKHKKFSVLHIRFSVEKKNFELCLIEVIYVIKRLKSIISSRDLEVSLPFYTTNNVFLQDDSAEMNFQIAYNEFILNSNYRKNHLANNNNTIALLKEVAKTVFRTENMCVVVVGNTNKITKKKIKEIASEL